MTRRRTGSRLAAGALAQLLLPLVALAALAAGGCRSMVAVIVDPALDGPTRVARRQFERDLHAAGYEVVETVSPFADPVAVRSYLQGLPRHRLRGAILIGDLPRAYQYVEFVPANPEIPAFGEEVISYQFYSDLDGTFAASPGYVSPGGHTHSYDVHDGAVDWEIWVGVLPVYEGDRAATVAAIERYLAKNHAYRTAGTSLPRRFLEVNEHVSATTATEHAVVPAGLRTGPYAWTPWSAAPAVGDLDRRRNFLTSVLYSPTSEVLVAKGTTNDSGGLGTNADGSYGRNVATRMAAGKSLGRALVDHVNVPLVPPWSTAREFHYASVVLLGDPTLGAGP